MHYANVGGSLHHLLATQLCEELPLESFGHNLGTYKVLLKRSPLIYERYRAPHDVLQKFDSTWRYRDLQILAACSWGSFCAGSWPYFLTVVGMVVSPHERNRGQSSDEELR